MGRYLTLLKVDLQIASPSAWSDVSRTYKPLPVRTTNAVAGPSVVMELSASRAVRHVNQETVVKSREVRAQNETKKKLMTIMDAIGSPLVCTSCWLLGKEDYAHKVHACPVDLIPDNERRSFRQYNLPLKHCWACGMPQV